MIRWKKIHLNSRFTTKSAPIAALSVTEANAVAHSMSGDHRWEGLMRAETREIKKIRQSATAASTVKVDPGSLVMVFFYPDISWQLTHTFTRIILGKSLFFSYHNILRAKVLTSSSDGASNIPMMWLQILSHTILQTKNIQISIGTRIHMAQ